MQALQYWAEKAKTPIPGQPCLLAGCVLELRRVMESYMSFSDDAILDGAASLEGSVEDVTGVPIPRGALPTSIDTPTKEEPTEGPTPMEVGTKEAATTEKILEGPTHPLVVVDNSAEGLTTPQTQHEGQRKLEAPRVITTVG